MRAIFGFAVAAGFALSCSSTTGETRGTEHGLGGANPASGSPGNSATRSVTGAVAQIADQTITVEHRPSPCGLTLNVDAATTVTQAGTQIGTGLSVLREGEQIRAVYDPVRRYASRIEVLDVGQSRSNEAPCFPQAEPSENEKGIIEHPAGD